MADITYNPQNDLEKKYFENLWEIANNRTPGSGNVIGGELSGITAVTFFQRSGVDKGFLKQIWSLSTPSSTMNLPQFFVALRFIAMIQNGEMPISKERLVTTAREKFELPKFNGIDIPKPVPVVQPIPQVAPAPVAPQQQALPPFSILPQDHAKYHGLFLQFDVNGDGYLTREESVGIFKQSGLDQASLDLIWSFADDDRDGRLTSKEFCAAFHIIICVTKRGHPLPNQLPLPLKNFLVNAPAIPGDVPQPSPVGAPQPVMQPVPVVAAPLPEPPAKIDISSAFGELDLDGPAVGSAPAPQPQITPLSVTPVAVAPISAATTPAPANFLTPVKFVPSSTTTTAPVSFATPSGGEDAELHSAYDAMKVATKKATASQEQALEMSSRTYSSLQGLKQRLATDRIALEATVTNAMQANQETNIKLEQITNEIYQLQEELKNLRLRLDETMRSSVNTQDRLLQAQKEKSDLIRDIEGTLKQLDSASINQQEASMKLQAADNELSGLAANKSSILSQSQQNQDEISSLAKENETLRSILSGVKSRLNSTIGTTSTLERRLQASEGNVSKQKQELSTLQKQLAAERQKIQLLENEKRSLLEDLRNVPVAAPAAVVSAPVLSTASVKEVDPFQDEDEEEAKQALTSYAAFDDDAFGSSSAPAAVSATFEDDPFGDAVQTTVTASVVAKAAQIDDPFAAEDAFAAAPVVAKAAQIDDPFAAEDAFAAAPVVSAANGRDPFGDFGDESVPAAAAVAPVVADKKSEVVVDPFTTENDPFGGFGAEGKAPVTTLSFETSDPFGGFDEPAAPSSPSKGTETIPAASFESTTDLFGDSFSATSSQPVTLNDDPFGTETVPAAAFEAAADPFADAAPASTTKEDPFGSFGEPAPASPLKSSNETVLIASFETTDPFGDFGASAAPAVVTTDNDPFGDFGDKPAAFQPAVTASSKSDDPFGDSNVVADPFVASAGFGSPAPASANEDPFSSSSSAPPSTATTSDPFAADFGSSSVTSTTAKTADSVDFKASDPFGDASGSTTIVDPFGAPSDPFGASAAAAPAAAASFGDDAFASFSASQSTPNDDPFLAPISSPSKAETKSDLFAAADDPFASAAPVAGAGFDSFSGFGDFGATGAADPFASSTTKADDPFTS